MKRDYMVLNENEFENGFDDNFENSLRLNMNDNLFNLLSHNFCEANK